MLMLFGGGGWRAIPVTCASSWPGDRTLSTAVTLPTAETMPDP